MLPKKTYWHLTNLHLDKCFEFTANTVVIKMFQREWIEGLAYKENQALENQKTRKSLENQENRALQKEFKRLTLLAFY